MDLASYIITSYAMNRFPGWTQLLLYMNPEEEERLTQTGQLILNLTEIGNEAMETQKIGRPKTALQKVVLEDMILALETRLGEELSEDTLKRLGSVVDDLKVELGHKEE